MHVPKRQGDNIDLREKVEQQILSKGATLKKSSRAKFSSQVSEAVLINRLYEDLLIPNDSSFDKKYYGSSTQSKIIMSSKCNEKKHGDYQLTYAYKNVVYEKSTTVSRAAKVEKAAFKKNAVAPLKSFSYDEEVPLNGDPVRFSDGIPGKPESDLQDGYCSDFASDTDNDIEEVFELE